MAETAPMTFQTKLHVKEFHNERVKHSHFEELNESPCQVALSNNSLAVRAWRAESAPLAHLEKQHQVAHACDLSREAETGISEPYCDWSAPGSVIDPASSE